MCVLRSPPPVIGTRNLMVLATLSVLVSSAAGGVAAQMDPGEERAVRVLFDAAHHNWLGEKAWSPLLDLLRKAGHTVRVDSTGFSPEGLREVDVVLLVNPSAHPREVRVEKGLEEYWWGRTSAEAALTEAEVDALVEWVSRGGGLFLMVGHAPSGAAVRNLVSRLGADVRNAITRDPALEDATYVAAGSAGRGRYIRFSRSTGHLRDHPITRGKSGEDRVESITTYVGTSVAGPSGSRILLALSEEAVDRYRDPPAEGGAVYEAPARGRAQAVAFSFGKGRVVIVSETGLFTTGEIRTEDGRVVSRGLGYEGAQPGRFARNAILWLAKRLP